VNCLQAALKRLVVEGHELGSHAAEHVRLSQLAPAEAQKQIEWAIGNISRVTGSQTVPVSFWACWCCLLLYVPVRNRRQQQQGSQLHSAGTC
jgi:peptidoglycan/xylan/chitin deacetylase (PgdA/CDA1 family)